MGRDEALKDDAVGRAWISVGLPILGLIFIVIMLAVATLAGFAREQDRAYVESTQRLMTGSVEGRAQTLSGIALDYGNWEQAYQSITVRWDPSWVGDNFWGSPRSVIALRTRHALKALKA
jgi:sensor domain CHASE-containing protein